MGNSPVRIVWKANSTLFESNADVSRKDKPCFSVKHTCAQRHNMFKVGIIFNFQNYTELGGTVQALTLH